MAAWYSCCSILRAACSASCRRSSDGGSLKEPPALRCAHRELYVGDVHGSSFSPLAMACSTSSKKSSLARLDKTLGDSRNFGNRFYNALTF
jgi:hypothetical protein